MNSLAGKVALVTGVSRRAGIGFAVARRILEAGASVFCQYWIEHDRAQPWGADPMGISGVMAGLEGMPGSVAFGEMDLSLPDSPRNLFRQTTEHFPHVDVLVVNHARSSRQSLTDATAEELDKSWAVNARASVLLVQAFAEQHDDDRPGGRVVLFTSGQHLGPMTDELPYAISKGAIHQMTLTLADALADRGITVNAVNPGPTDTGWADTEAALRITRASPGGRWNQPDDVARVVAWLVSGSAAPITGQIINAEGGFRRS